MTLLIRHTDVLGGIVGGWDPLVPFAGWRTYSVTDVYTDPDSVELPIFRLLKTGGPTTDTISQVQSRTATGFVDRTWPMGGGLLRGSYPGLAWYLMNPTTMALVAGPLLPIGNVAVGNLSQEYRDKAPITNHVLQWFDQTTPITGPYLAVLVAREPSSELPLWISGHPVEIAVNRLAAKGESYDATSAAAVQTALGAELQYILPVTSSDDTPQELLDTMSAAFGFGIRRSETNGSAEFMLWREKLGSIAALPVLGNAEIRADGGPTFDLSDTTRLNRIRVTGQVIRPWETGTQQIKEKTRLLFLGRSIATKSRWRVISNPNATDKPASGLVIESADVTYDYSTDGVTPDADLYGEQEGQIDLGGMPGMLNSVAGGASPVNLEQWAEGLARLLFDEYARGRQMATAVGIRGTDFDDALLGNAVVFDLGHLPNAQRGQSPTSQRGGTRPFRVMERTEEVLGPVIVAASEGTGVQYATVPVLTLTVDPDFNTSGLLIVTVSPANTFAAAGVQVEFQVRVFADSAPSGCTDPGFRYTVVDTTAWTDEPHMLKLGPFPPQHTVFVRARAWQFEGAASDWSNWRSPGGDCTGPQTTLSDLRITNITDEGAQLDWSYDEAPAIGQVKVQIRDVSGGFIGPYTTFSTLAAGTETETLTGLTSGHLYEVRLVLIDGSAVEYGDVLLGTFACGGGKISSLVISSVTASEAKVAWTSTDASHPVGVYYRVTGDPLWQVYQNLPASSTRIRLVALTPSTGYDVMIQLLVPFAPPLTGGFPIGDGAGNANGLQGSFTTLAISVTLDPPLFAGVFGAFNPFTGLAEGGFYGIKLFANPQNPMPHDMVILEAVETAVGSGIPGTFAEVATVAAVSGDATYWTNTAPNDGKLRYLKALSRKTGYNDSVETEYLGTDPWATSPVPPIGGGTPGLLDITAAGLASGANGTGFFALPDGSEIYRVEGPDSQEFRIRLYKTETGRDADLARPDTDQNWPASLLFDARVTAAEGYLLDLDTRRIRVVLSQLPDLYVYWTLTNDEAGTEDIRCRLSYFASSVTTLA